MLVSSGVQETKNTEQSQNNTTQSSPPLSWGGLYTLEETMETEFTITIKVEMGTANLRDITPRFMRSYAVAGIKAKLQTIFSEVAVTNLTWDTCNPEVKQKSLSRCPDCDGYFNHIETHFCRTLSKD